MTAAHARPRVKLSEGAQITDLTPHGLLKILKRTKNAIRDDGHWFVYPEVIEQIAAARQILGLDHKNKE